MSGVRVLTQMAERAGVAGAGLRWRVGADRARPRWDAPPGPVRSPGGRSAPPPPRSPRPVPDAWAQAPGTRAVLLVGLAAGVCVAAPLLVLFDAPSWARAPAVVLLFALAPGTALLGLLQPPGARMEAGLVLCAGLAVTVLTAQLMLWAGAWHPRLFVYLLAAIALAGLARSRARLSRSRVARPRAPDTWSAGRAPRNRESNPARRDARPAAPTSLSPPKRDARRSDR
jgi:hypothetical protein